MMTLKELVAKIDAAGPVDWPFECQVAAGSEGWDLFDTGGAEGHDVFELEVLAEPGMNFGSEQDEPMFPDDASAAIVVLGRALDGSPLHQHALTFLHQEAPVEFAMILTMWVTGDDEYVGYDAMVDTMEAGAANFS